ncbi:MAG: hypothetical protein HYZ48_02500, partial [Chlamydiales bacterium]|nr:hypothetical protein [Chlamydiales bacterium]
KPLYADLGDSSAAPLQKRLYAICEELMEQNRVRFTEVMNNPLLQPNERTGQLQALLEGLSKELGRALFLTDHPEELPPAFKLADLDPSFQRAIDKKVKEFYREAPFFKKFSLQDFSLVCGIQIPFVIADLLLTSKGRLNLQLIPDIKEAFFLDRKENLEYQKGISKMLKQMDSSWQAEIDRIQPPLDEKGPSSWMIRADLGLAPSDPITLRHAQIEAIASILTQLCQGPVGDCFAVAWAIKKQQEFALNALKDYRDLIHFGYLVRQVDGVDEPFFFKTTIADDSLSESIAIDAKGYVLSVGAPFSQCPHFISACRLMGIDPAAALPAILKQLQAEKSSSGKKVTWEHL